MVVKKYLNITKDHRNAMLQCVMVGLLYGWVNEYNNTNLISEIQIGPFAKIFTFRENLLFSQIELFYFSFSQIRKFLISWELIPVNWKIKFFSRKLVSRFGGKFAKISDMKINVRDWFHYKTEFIQLFAKARVQKTIYVVPPNTYCIYSRICIK